MDWQYIHAGYYRAEHPMTDDSFVVRTRPKNDGWMAIHESDGLVMATGLSLKAARDLCESVAAHDYRELLDWEHKEFQW